MLSVQCTNKFNFFAVFISKYYYRFLKLNFFKKSELITGINLEPILLYSWAQGYFLLHIMKSLFVRLFFT